MTDLNKLLLQHKFTKGKPDETAQRYHKLWQELDCKEPTIFQICVLEVGENYHLHTEGCPCHVY